MPISATGEGVAQMVSGKLMEEGRASKSIQVLLSDNQLQLADVGSVFLTVALEETEEQQIEPEQDSETEKRGGLMTINPQRKNSSICRRRRKTWNRS